MEAIIILTLAVSTILYFWSWLSLRKRINENKDREYFELNAKLNFITAFGSLLIIVFTFLGWHTKKTIIEEAEAPINKMVTRKSHDIDSIIDSKNILKAGIYIVNNLEFKENKIIKFESLMTIDNKHLPIFEHAPKLIISTNTGENLRIKEITKSYFILATPVSKNFVELSAGDNPEYPSTVKFDLWIADYEPK